VNVQVMTSCIHVISVRSWFSFSARYNRREGLSYKFFKKMIRPDSCIHHLIPEKRDESILSRLTNPSQYSIPLARTERFKRSFVLYALRSFPTDISGDLCDDFIDI